jgi:hypothetical protein
MRYRHLSYRYAMLVRYGQTWPFGSDVWPSGRLRLLVPTPWRPDADTYETATAVEVVVDLAGVETTRWSSKDTAGLSRPRKGLCTMRPAFATACSGWSCRYRRPWTVEARYDRGLFRITLPKRVRPG